MRSASPPPVVARAVLVSKSETIYHIRSSRLPTNLPGLLDYNINIAMPDANYTNAGLVDGLSNLNLREQDTCAYAQEAANVETDRNRSRDKRTHPRID